MSNTEQDPVQALYEACQSDLGDPDLWYDPDGYPDSLALCIIDSIYSTGAHYSSVVNVVRRYRDDRTAKGGNADTDGTAELLANIDDFGDTDTWASKIGNRRPTSTTKGAPLKAEAIQQIATKLTDLEIRTAAHLRSAANSTTLEEAKSAWTSTPGQRSGITWDYALMLAGIPGVKADRMVVRYVTRALGRIASEVAPTEAAALVGQVAERMNEGFIRTDHAIWRFESGRPVNRDGDPIEPEPEEELTNIPPGKVTTMSDPESSADLALVIIEAIFAPGVRYDSVVRILDRYRQYRAGQDGKAGTDGVSELLATFAELGGPEVWASAMDNRRRRQCGAFDGLVSEVAFDVGRRLDDLGVRRIEDLRAADANGRLATVEQAWRSAPCQSSGVTWGYALLLAGFV